MADTAELIAQQKAMLEFEHLAYKEAKERYQAEIHELRRAYELDAMATDRAIVARSLELDARAVKLDERAAALTEREAYIDKVSLKLKGLLE